MSDVPQSDPLVHPQPVDLADPIARASWLAGLREHTEDLAAAALDATAPPAERRLGRLEAREHIEDAARAIRDAFAAAGVLHDVDDGYDLSPVGDVG
jgi:hypothetical protein